MNFKRKNKGHRIRRRLAAQTAYEPHEIAGWRKCRLVMRLLDEIDDLEITVTALTRLNDAKEPVKLISYDDMNKAFE